MQAETLDAIEAIKSAVDLLRKHVGWDTALDRAAAFEAQISAHLISGTVRKMHSV